MCVVWDIVHVLSNPSVVATTEFSALKRLALPWYLMPILPIIKLFFTIFGPVIQLMGTNEQHSSHSIETIATVGHLLPIFQSPMCCSKTKTNHEKIHGYLTLLSNQWGSILMQKQPILMQKQPSFRLAHAHARCSVHVHHTASSMHTGCSAGTHQTCKQARWCRNYWQAVSSGSNRLNSKKRCTLGF